MLKRVEDGRPRNVVPKIIGLVGIAPTVCLAFCCADNPDADFLKETDTETVSDGDVLSTDTADDTETETDEAPSDTGLPAGPGSCAAPYVFEELAEPVGPGTFRVAGTPEGSSSYSGSCSDKGGFEAVYRIQAPADGLVAFELTGADPVLYIRNSFEDPATELACNDDFYVVGWDSVVFVDAEAGETYYVFADSYSPNEASPFELTVTIDPEITTPVPDRAWTSVGYGYGLTGEGGEMALYETTDISCIKLSDGPDASLQQFLDYISVVDEDTIEARKEGHELPFTLARAEALPEVCNDGGTPTIGDEGYAPNPLFVFDVFAAIFEENYPFFALRGEAWPALLTTHRTALSDETDERELFERMAEMILSLHDGHVWLGGDEGSIDSANSEGYMRLLDECEERGEPDPEVYIKAQLARFRENADSYLSFPAERDEALVWGFVSDAMGYLRIDDFMDTSTHFGETFDRAVADLGSADTLIIDVRLNNGGSGVPAPRGRQPLRRGSHRPAGAAGALSRLGRRPPNGAGHSAGSSLHG